MTRADTPRANAPRERRRQRARSAGRCLFVVAVGATTAGAVSCVDLDALTAGSQPPDGSTTPPRPPQQPDPTPTCALAKPPPPSGSVPGASLATFTLAVSDVHIDSERTPGFDLDDTCTYVDGGKDAPPPAIACRPPAGSIVIPDLDGGVDNAVGVYSKSVGTETVAIDTSARDLVHAGLRSLVILVGDYNGQANDDVVRVSISRAEGRTRTCGDAGDPDAGDPDAGDVDAGTVEGACVERWDVNNDDSYRDDAGRPTFTLSTTGYVTNHQLVAQFAEASWRVVHLPFSASHSLPVWRALVTGRLVESGDDDGGARSFTIEDGAVSGYVFRSEFVEALATMHIFRQPVCKWPTYAEVWRPSICVAGDIASTVLEPGRDAGEMDGGDDAGLPVCNALSISVGFRATPAEVGARVDLDASSPCSEVDPELLRCP